MLTDAQVEENMLKKTQSLPLNKSSKSITARQLSRNTLSEAENKLLSWNTFSKKKFLVSTSKVR